jgi:1-acyl-sn-glycerol-3-phosphate acyltransferase
MRRLIYLIIALIIFLIPIVAMALLPWQTKYKVYKKLYRILCKILNVEVEMRGEICNEKPLIFVGNHTSYLDILILGSVLPASFISKASVANWPLVGQLGKLTGTLFIKRDRNLADSHVHQMHKALEAGESLIFFPEGTTGAGVRPLPFKSSLFRLAENHKVYIQPVTIRYSHINGLPVYRNEKTELSWIGDMTLMPHLSHFLQLGRVRVEVIMHQPIPPAENLETVDRKKLAKQCEDIVAAAY